MQNCNCFGCKPSLIPAGYGGNICSICKTPIGAFPGIPFLGSVCVKCLNNDHLIEDPVYKIKFPKCTCGKIVHNHNLLYHGVLQPVPGHNTKSEDIKAFRLSLCEAKGLK